MKTKQVLYSHYLSALLITLLLISIPLHSDATEKYSTVMQFGLEGGGDPLVATTGEDINAGGGIEFAGGLMYEPSEDSPYSFQATIGYRFDSVDFVGGDADYKTIPLTLVAFYRASDSVRLGAGFTYHLSPSLQLNYLGSSLNVDFDNALGTVFVFNYEPTYSHIFYGAQFTSIDYTYAGSNIDASSFGIFIGQRF